MISVIIPTIPGREETLDRCWHAYVDTMGGLDYELCVVEGFPNWPSACNAGYRDAKGDILHFTADDLEPLPGWWVAPLELLATADELPAARVLNHTADGPMDNAGDGPDGAFTHFTRVPIMRRDQYDRIGAWPEIDYCADVWLSEKARTIGIQTRLLYSYALVHHWSQIGRIDTPERLAAAGQALEQLRAEMAA